jgi:hypothetical protein
VLTLGTGPLDGNVVSFGYSMFCKYPDLTVAPKVEITCYPDPHGAARA